MHPKRSRDRKGAVLRYTNPKNFGL
jgi:hypothetical protein